MLDRRSQESRFVRRSTLTNDPLIATRPRSDGPDLRSPSSVVLVVHGATILTATSITAPPKDLIVTRDARRIVSLLPGATEWVCELGLASRLVGVSHECDHPPQVNSLPRVTRSRFNSQQSSSEIDAVVRQHSETRTPLYDLDADTLARLKPDLILTQSLCNVSERDVLASISAFADQCRILDLRAQAFEQVLTDAAAIAEATGRQEQSVRSIESLQQRVNLVRERTSHSSSPRPVVTLLEWVDPLFCAGHWTPQLIEWAGGDDPIGQSGQPSHVISQQELFTVNPNILLVACCGMDAARTRSELSQLERVEGWSQLRCVKTGHVHAFDGSAYFNRPGPRLVDALEAVAELIRQWQADHGGQTAQG